MKKFLTYVLVIILLFCFNSKAMAEEISTDIKVNGEIRKGNNLEILIDLKGVERLYAGDMEFNYDAGLLKVNSLRVGELISSSNINKTEICKDIDNVNGKVRYKFTCLGKANGYFGRGTFIAINAELIKEGKVVIDKKKLKLELYERTESNEIKEIAYKLTNFEKDIKKESAADEFKDNKDNNISLKNVQGSEKTKKELHSNDKEDLIEKKEDLTEKKKGNIKSNQSNDKSINENKAKDSNNLSEKDTKINYIKEQKRFWIYGIIGISLLIFLILIRKFYRKKKSN